MTVKSAPYVPEAAAGDIDSLNAALALAGLDESIQQAAMDDEDEIVAEAEALDIPLTMAGAIVAALETRGQCRTADLTAQGFSLDDIARYWDVAVALATAGFGVCAEEDAEDEEAARDAILSSLLVA